MLKILLLCSDPVTLALMRASADALKGVLDAFDDAADLQRKLNKGANGMPVAVVFDLAALAARGIRLANACTRVRQTLPEAKIGVIASATHWVDDVIVEWARDAGADYAVAQINPWRWNLTGERLLNELVGERGAVDAAMRRITPYIRAAAQTTTGGAQARVLAAAEAEGIDLAALAFRMQRSGGVNIADRSYLLRIYPECFVASESIVWLERALRISRDKAIAIGQALQAAGLIYHVVRDQVFDYGNYYFRVAQLPPRWTLDRFYSLVRSEAGFAVADRSFRGANYASCFVGSEAVDWMLVQNYTLNQAMSCGQRLLDVSLAHHVLDEHPFKNEKLFYRFYRDEQRLE